MKLLGVFLYIKFLSIKPVIVLIIVQNMLRNNRQLIQGGFMYKNNDEVIAWEAKRLLDDGIYTDTEQAYLEAEKIVINIREQAKQRQIKQQFKLKIKSIKKKIGNGNGNGNGNGYVDVPYANKKKHWGDKS